MTTEEKEQIDLELTELIKQYHEMKGFDFPILITYVIGDDIGAVLYGNCSGCLIEDTRKVISNPGIIHTCSLSIKH